MKSRNGVNLDARGLLQLSRSSCKRQQVILRSGFEPGAVARAVYHVDPHDEQSPTALALGVQFEHRLYENGGAHLLEQYIHNGVLLATDAEVADLQKQLAPDALALTKRYIEDRLAGRPAPNLIIQGVLPTDTFGFTTWVKPDLLVSKSGDRFYIPGEIKSFEARAGYTDAIDVDSATAQAAVSLVILQRLYPEYLECDVVDIVLRAPSSLRARIWRMPAMRDIEMISRAAQRWAETPIKEDLDESSLSPSQIERIENNYRPACLQSCGLSSVCRKAARAAQEPAVLGDDSRRAFAQIPEGLAILDREDVTGGWDVERIAIANALVNSVRADKGDAA